MTLNDLERQNKGFYGFFGDFRLRDTFQEEIAPKPTEIDMDKLRMKFLVLNADFNDLSVDFFRFKETCAWGHQIKSRDEMAGDRLTVCEQELL